MGPDAESTESTTNSTTNRTTNSTTNNSTTDSTESASGGGSRHSRPPVLLVADTLCSGLALDVQLGELYWTSASGHTLWKLGYRSYNDSYFEAHPNEPVYSISNPDDANVAQVVVSGHGLTGDFGKDRDEAPVLLSAVIDDPDDGDAIFSAGDTLTMRFDRATNVSDGLINVANRLSLIHI